MSVTNGLIDGYNPVVFRNFAAAAGPGDLTVRSGVPKRCACLLSLENVSASASTAVFQGQDGASVTVNIPAATVYQLIGNFSSLPTLGAGVSAVVGWVDDGKVQPNP